MEKHLYFCNIKFKYLNFEKETSIYIYIALHKEIYL